jgi:CPA1 family monovalent cation:H+ antiporter
MVGTVRPAKWSHVLFWGGLRGSIPIALLLGLPDNPLLDKYRPQLLVAGFGIVFFSLVIQGITMKPLLSILKVSGPKSS